MRRALAAGLLLAASLAVAREPPQNPALHAIFERQFHDRLEERPEEATFLGIEGHNHRLSDLSPRAIARRKANTRRVIEELEGIDPARLNTQDRISRDAMLDDLRLDAEEDALYGDLPFGARDSWRPLTPTRGPHRSLAFLVKATPFRHARDYQDYLKRLEAMPAVIAQQTFLMRVGMGSGWMPPAEAMARVPAMLDPFAAADVKATPLWQPFTKFPPAIGEADRRRLTETAERVLSQAVHPAFARLRSFVVEEYLPATARSLAASKLPAGPAYYAQRVRKQTTTRMAADEIHELGLREVARIRAEMEKVIASTGFTGGFAEFVKFINSDPRFFFTQPEDRLRAYRDIAKRADAELPKLFAELPRTPYGIRPMDAFEGDNADNYSRPALDGSRAGFFNANVNNLAARPSWEMEAVLLHEAVPGHHLQIARAQELKGLPVFRRSGHYVAYGEGWALYAESLGYEMGFYKDPYMRFGALAMEMLRACRLVVDTGMHTRDWGREQSIRYLMENAALKEGFATAEVDRYIVDPGQALGYKIGQLRIKALRAKASEALGAQFDLPRFHNALLDDGALPLTVLEARIDEWIASQRQRANAAAAETPANKALHALFEREFRNTLEEHPEEATFLGIEGHDHRLTDWSPAAIARRKARVKRVIFELQRFDPKKLSTQDRISREVMLADLRLAAEEHALYGKLPFSALIDWMPISQMHGPHSFLSQLAKATAFRRSRDYDNYVKRLEAVPRALEQQVALMRAGLASGWTAPQAAIQRVPSMLDTFAAADPTATALWQPFANFPVGVAEHERPRLVEAGRRVLAEKVHPAFSAYKRFLEAEYLPRARKTLAASSLPAGRAYYALRARSQTTTTMAPEEIHSTGLAEVARIRAEMDKAIAAAHFTGSFAEFVKFVNSDKRFFFSRPEDRLAAYRDIAKRADAELPRFFAELPRTPYGIRPMEAFEGDNFDHYSAPALDGSRAGFFDANVNNLQNRPTHEMEATLLHEAVPGHHLQVARSYELRDLPRFRRTGWYVAYGEGWALYAESLGYEMGFYTDPYDRFGALSAEMLRACRLVVDTGLHMKGWSREQAIRYLIDNAALNEPTATAEVDRYIVWAGQALGYKIGELRIKELRRRAAAALGDRFNLRRFHNAVLDDGALPLTVLEARIEEWINRERSGPIPARLIVKE